MSTRILATLTLPVALALTAISAPSQAALILCEPDDFAAGTDLTSACPGVTLTVDIGPGPVTASEPTPFASTGDQVFRSPRDIDWLTGSEELRATFDALTSMVLIDLVSDGTDDPGFLRAWSIGNALLEEVLLVAPGGSFVTASITRASADIAYITAGSSGGGIEDLHLDNLQFEVASIPEPSVLALMGAGLLGIAYRRRKQA